MTMTTIGRAVVGILMAAALVAGSESQSAAADSTVSRVRAHQTDSWRVWVSAGWHHVTVSGDHDTDLDLYVYDAGGDPLAVDDDDTDYCVGQFYMPSGGYIKIYVRNLGSVYNEYELSVR